MCKLLLFFISTLYANPAEYWNGDQLKDVDLTPADFAAQAGWIEHVGDSADLDFQGEWISQLAITNNVTLHTIRKYRQLIAMIMSLQNDKVWVRYRGYGCWCFINGRHSLESGSGTPVDEIDHSCMRFSKCYRCLAMDFPNFDPFLKYSFDTTIDRCLPTRSVITCLDPKGTMKRSMCECDKELALKLAVFEEDWDPNNTDEHFFDRGQCITGQGQRVDECCGVYPKRYPFSTNQGTRGCCGERIYSKEYFQCCNDSDITNIEDAC